MDCIVCGFKGVNIFNDLLSTDCVHSETNIYGYLRFLCHVLDKY